MHLYFHISCALLSTQKNNCLADVVAQTKELKELSSNTSYFILNGCRLATIAPRMWKSSRLILVPLPILATRQKISKQAQRRVWIREEGELQPLARCELAFVWGYTWRERAHHPAMVSRTWLRNRQLAKLTLLNMLVLSLQEQLVSKPFSFPNIFKKQFGCETSKVIKADPQLSSN